MELRTTFDISPSVLKITHEDPVLFTGSCFSASIGRKFELGHLPVMINPSGTVYNPVSVFNTIGRLMSGEHYEIKDLHEYNGMWVSFDHYMDFSSSNPVKTLESVNSRLDEARKFLEGARFLFITFGTARVYRWNETGRIVSNCHKIPSAYFTNELLAVNDIVSLWDSCLDALKAGYPELKVVFTISPVRHWKDGAHGNQVSKSVLFLGVEELLRHPSKPMYLPAYELLMDDLRDYRYYNDDMLHPSSSAIEYIWEAFSNCYFDEKTRELWNEIYGISKAVTHRIQSGSVTEKKKFADTMISRIDSITKKKPGIDLSSERSHFAGLLS
jgi:hypothetical protein